MLHTEKLALIRSGSLNWDEAKASTSMHATLYKIATQPQFRNSTFCDHYVSKVVVIRDFSCGIIDS